MVLRLNSCSYFRFRIHWSCFVHFALLTAFTIGVYQLFSSSTLTLEKNSSDHDALASHQFRSDHDAKTTMPSPTSTRMTFDPSLIVHCKESPYVICEQTPVVELNRTFKISVPNYQKWFKENAISMKSCRYKNCIYQGDTFDASSDIVVVYSILLDTNRPMPKQLPNQSYVFMGFEAPYLFYGFLEVEIAKNKTKTVAWLISHCLAESKREEYVKEMRKYVDVDILGLCGETCPQDKYPCMQHIALTYKFYIAFENALCTDYITEKFFKNFNPDLPIIPVVRARADFDRYFPEKTFISTGNFETAKDLALFLKRLGSDLETYSQYLEHKDLYKMSDDYLYVVGCSLCEQLNTKTIEPKQYDTHEWFIHDQCEKDPMKDVR